MPVHTYEILDAVYGVFHFLGNQRATACQPGFKLLMYCRRHSRLTPGNKAMPGCKNPASLYKREFADNADDLSICL